jgi:hypothetical protein
MTISSLLFFSFCWECGKYNPHVYSDEARSYERTLDDKGHGHDEEIPA